SREADATLRRAARRVKGAQPRRVDRRVPSGTTRRDGEMELFRWQTHQTARLRGRSPRLVAYSRLTAYFRVLSSAGTPCLNGGPLAAMTVDAAAGASPTSVIH